MAEKQSSPKSLKDIKWEDVAVTDLAHMMRLLWFNPEMLERLRIVVVTILSC